MWDDFVLTDFVLRLSQNPSFTEKIRLFFAQHNAHRIVYDRLITYLIYLLTGQMDFRLMMCIGNLSLIGLIWLFWKSIQKSGLSLWYVVPVPYILLSLQGFENTFWAMAALQNYTVLFWVFLSAYLLIINCLGWAAAVAVVATFTSGNGQFAFVIGLLILLYQHRPRRDWLVWLVVMVSTISLYFIGYNRLPQELLTTKFILNFFAFNGAAFADGSANVRWPLVIGCIITIWLSIVFVIKILFPLFKSRKLAAEHEQFLMACLAFIVASSLLVAASHREELPIQETLVSRYKIYSHLFLVLSYLLTVFSLEKTYRKIVLFFSIFFGINFWAYAYYDYFELMNYRRRDATITAFNFRYNGTCLMGISHAATMDSIYRKLEAKDLYHLPTPIAFPSQVKNASTIMLKTTEGRRKLLYFTPLVNTLSVVNDNFAFPNTYPDQGIFIVLCSSSKTYLFNVHPNQAGRKQFFTMAELYRKGFWTEIHKPLLPMGLYRLGVLIAANGHSHVEMTNQTIPVKDNELSK